MKKNKILYVDDDPVHICIMCGIIGGSNFEIVPASSAAEGIRILNETPEIKIVISDWCMPEMNGVEFIQFISNTYSDKLCYMISSNNKLDSIERLEKRGDLIRYFQKPISKDVLLKEIEKVADIYASNKL